MKIATRTIIELDDTAVAEVFNQRLGQLCEDCWIDGDNVMTEVYTSHRFDTVVGKVDDPKLALRVAAIRLKEELRKKDRK